MDEDTHFLTDFLVENVLNWPKIGEESHEADAPAVFDCDMLDDDLLLFLSADDKHSLDNQNCDQRTTDDYAEEATCMSIAADVIESMDTATATTNANESSSNIEWARYLTSIDDIVSDAIGGDQTIPLESLSATLSDPLQSDTDRELQHRVIEAFGLGELLKLADGLPPPISRRPHYVDGSYTNLTMDSISNGSLYLIPLSDGTTRYQPFDMCKQFVEQLKDQPKSLRKLIDEIRAGNQRQVVIRFRPKYETPRAPARLTMKEKLATIQAEEVHIPLITEAKKRRCRKSAPILIKI